MRLPTGLYHTRASRRQDLKSFRLSPAVAELTDHAPSSLDHQLYAQQAPYHDPAPNDQAGVRDAHRLLSRGAAVSGRPVEQVAARDAGLKALRKVTMAMPTVDQDSPLGGSPRGRGQRPWLPK